jgi:hypothetical protein
LQSKIGDSCRAKVSVKRLNRAFDGRSFAIGESLVSWSYNATTARAQPPPLNSTPLPPKPQPRTPTSSLHVLAPADGANDAAVEAVRKRCSVCTLVTMDAGDCSTAATRSARSYLAEEEEGSRKSKQT